jgi:hypothetical protein
MTLKESLRNVFHRRNLKTIRGHIEDLGLPADETKIVQQMSVVAYFKGVSDGKTPESVIFRSRETFAKPGEPNRLPGVDNKLLPKVIPMLKWTTSSHMTPSVFVLPAL